MSRSIRSALTLLALAFAAPAVAQNPFASAGTPVVIGQRYELPSQRLGEARRISVMLPPGYAEANNRARYPVLYLLDREDAPEFLHVAGLVHQGSLAKVTTPVILVAVESEDRRRELTTGRSEDFRRFLTEELKPRIAAAYRTDGTDALIGARTAGLFVVETALRHGGAFDRYIAVSPSLGRDRESLSRDAARLLASANQAPRILWLTTGSEGGETQRGMDRLVAALQRRTPGGMTWTYAPMPGETAASILHPAMMRALRMLFPAPR